MSRHIPHSYVLIALSAVSCSMPNGGASDPAESELAERAAAPEEKRTLPQTPKNPDLQSIVELATDDLVARFKQRQAGNVDIKVIEAERVTWRSSALGCPQPDRGYLMVLTPGYLIRLNAEGQTWEYHSTLRGPPFLCEPPGSIESPVPHSPELDPT